MGLILYLIIGAIAGWLAGKIMKGKGFGLWMNMLIGVIGAFIGSFLFKYLNIEFYGLVGFGIGALVGAIILLWLVRIFKKT